MFWDKVSGVYDLFETIYNGRVYRDVGKRAAKEIEPDDIVLECDFWNFSVVEGRMPCAVAVITKE